MFIIYTYMNFPIILMHGWYSEKQFSMLKDEKNNPYMYYLDFNHKIVQLTEITNSETYNSKWDDVVYMGAMKRFYMVQDAPLTFSQINTQIS